MMTMMVLHEMECNQSIPQDFLSKKKHASICDRQFDENMVGSLLPLWKLTNDAFGNNRKSSAFLE